MGWMEHFGSVHAMKNLNDFTTQIVSVSDMIIICLSIRLCCVYMILNKFRALYARATLR